MLNWLIIGGGLHGVHLALTLIRSAGLAPDSLRILDPHSQLIARWTCLTGNTGMTHLRSPAIHHLDLDRDALSDYAAARPDRRADDFLGSYRRPSYRLFQQHSQQLIEQHDLARLLLQGSARALRKVGSAWRVETEQGRIEARHVALAFGRTGLAWPEWARSLAAQGASICHVFDEGYRASLSSGWRHLLVVGGGITAAQTALGLAAQHPGRVSMLMRHGLRRSDFDASPCWIGPRCRHDFAQVGDYSRRRRLIREARQRGSVPPDVQEALEAACATGNIRLYRSEVEAAQPGEPGESLLTLSDGQQLSFDRVVLATGFEPTRPGGRWLDEAIAAERLKVAPCGFPVTGYSLAWAQGLYVSGPLAELEIGPVAPNIIGARLAALRIAVAARN